MVFIGESSGRHKALIPGRRWVGSARGVCGLKPADNRTMALVNRPESARCLIPAGATVVLARRWPGAAALAGQLDRAEPADRPHCAVLDPPNSLAPPEHASGWWQIRGTGWVGERTTVWPT